jgi:hypothetical protein
MTKFTKVLAGLTLAAGLALAAPQAAMAQHWHGGGGHWHGGGGHWHGGGWGGFGPGFALGLGFGAAPYYGYGPYYAAPYAYGGNCGWVRHRVWRGGYWVVRRAWRCW